MSPVLSAKLNILLTEWFHELADQNADRLLSQSPENTVIDMVGALNSAVSRKEVSILATRAFSQYLYEKMHLNNPEDNKDISALLARISNRQEENPSRISEGLSKLSDLVSACWSKLGTMRVDLQVDAHAETLVGAFWEKIEKVALCMKKEMYNGSFLVTMIMNHAKDVDETEIEDSWTLLSDKKVNILEKDIFEMKENDDIV